MRRAEGEGRGREDIVLTGVVVVVVVSSTPAVGNEKGGIGGKEH